MDQQIDLLPILADPVINGFLMDFIPCLYAEVIEGRFVQNEETASIAESSMWMMRLVNLKFFTKAFQEISANRDKAPGKADGSGKKN